MIHKKNQVFTIIFHLFMDILLQILPSVLGISDTDVTVYGLRCQSLGLSRSSVLGPPPLSVFDLPPLVFTPSFGLSFTAFGSVTEQSGKLVWVWVRFGVESGSSPDITPLLACCV